MSANNETLRTVVDVLCEEDGISIVNVSDATDAASAANYVDVSYTKQNSQVITSSVTNKLIREGIAVRGRSDRRIPSAPIQSDERVWFMPITADIGGFDFETPEPEACL